MTSIIPLTLAAIACAVFATWFLTPLSGDSRIFFAAARQADYLGNFPNNVHRSWELKPLGHRIAIYGVYKGATGISDFGDKASFERAVKIVYGTVIFLATAAFVLAIRDFLKANSLSPPIVFLALLILLFSTSHLVTFQPEEFSLLLLMAAVALVLTKSRNLALLAGLPLAALFTLKGVTGLLALEVFIMLSVLGKDYRSSLLWGAAGTTAWVVALLVVVVVAFPGELRDLRNATLIQGSIEFDFKGILSVPWAFWHKFQLAPVLGPAVILVWLTLPALVWNKRWTSLAALLCAWGISGVIVLAQGLFFGYHYAVFVVPAVGSLYLIFSRTWDLGPQVTIRRLVYMAAWASVLGGVLLVLVYADRQTTDVVPFRVIGFNLVVLVVALMLLGTWLLARYTIIFKNPATLRTALPAVVLMVAGAFWLRYQAPWTQFPERADVIENERRFYADIEDVYHLSEQNELLYLAADGGYAYYFGAPTHCRYFTSLPIIRVNSKVGAKSLRQSSVYRDTLDCILSYEGDYVTLGPGDPLGKTPGIAEKLVSEYTLILERMEYPSISLYKRNEPASN